MVVRQISGKIARRIVCDLRPGEMLGRGQKIGMIKFGSRTELIIPDGKDLAIEVDGRPEDSGRHDDHGEISGKRMTHDTPNHEIEEGHSALKSELPE